MMYPLMGQSCVPSAAMPSWLNPSVWPISCVTVTASRISRPLCTWLMPALCSLRQHFHGSDSQGLTLVHFSAQPEPCLSLKLHGPPSVSHKKRL